MSDEPGEGKPARFDRYRERAGRLIAEREKLNRLVSGAEEKLSHTDGGWSGRFRAVRDELALLIELLRAYYRRDYTSVSKSTLVTIAAAVLYFLMPLDVIPDFLLGFGYLDDAAVIGYVVATVREEIDAFRVFVEQNGRTDE